MSECEQVGIRRRRRLSRVLVVAGALAGMSVIWNLAQECSADAAGIAEVIGAPEIGDSAAASSDAGAAVRDDHAGTEDSDSPGAVDGMLRAQLLGPVRPNQEEPGEPTSLPAVAMPPANEAPVVDADQLVPSTVRIHESRAQHPRPQHNGPRGGEHPQWPFDVPAQRDVPAFSGSSPMEVLDGPRPSPVGTENASRDEHVGSFASSLSDRNIVQRQAGPGSVPSAPAYAPSSCAGVDSGSPVPVGFDWCRSEQFGSTGTALAGAPGTGTRSLVSMSGPQPVITPD